mmetsp:Transcript_20149/g.51942  ORF Transcript_20149/g.51942 Transcript_20149/m.51942 type:complete len:281 (-) Transcript_20149:137-979(-)
MPASLKARYGDWALVTGGHSGIGYEMADQLAAVGINLVIAARTQAALDEAASKLKHAHGVEVRTVSADMSSAAGVEKLIAACADLDIGLLVANAGMELHGHFVSTDASKLSSMVSLNVMAPTMLAHHFGGLMVKRGKGGILFTSSVIGWNPTPYFSAYCGTKAYINMLGESLSAELSEYGVDVSVVSPGATETPMIANAKGFDLSKAPFQMGKPKDVAAVGLRALGSNANAVPGLANRLLTFLQTRCFPRALVGAVGRTLLKNAIPEVRGHPFGAVGAVK